MNTEDLKEFIEKQVEDAVTLIFNNAHGAAMTISGDITPTQSGRLSEIKEQLQDLIQEQVEQNLQLESIENFDEGYEGQFEGRNYKVIDQGLFGNGNVDWRLIKFKDNGEEKAIHKSVLETLPMKEWNVPVMRTGYAHTLIAVSARTEQEAIELAIDEAGGESFSEKSSEYSAEDGAHEIK